MKSFLALLETMRLYQWIKNLLVFAPLVFAEKLIEFEAAGRAMLAFVSFGLVASAIYLMNDLLDVERDRQHPEKCKRPLPSGRLARPLAQSASLVLVAGGLALAYIGGFLIWPLVYWVINIAYSLRLKHMVVLDAMCIAIGFLLRVYAGGEAIGVPVSPWLTLCTFFVALLLAFAKRRHELSLLGEESTGHRQSLRDYSVAYLDQMIAPLGAMTVLAYAAYTVSPATIAHFGPNLVFTVPFVVFGIFRYLYLVHQRSEGGNPTKLLLKDLQLLINTFAWFGVSVWVVYGKG
ncbi:MAG: decaprenyl-phosphate phosphoribosyltransferase [Planctomycetota bacterium]|nr:MAG: decaprenyl-phosphate phosphoribosyltransferase [Planctomycetota bacterium]